MARKDPSYKEPPSFRKIRGKKFVITAYSYERPGEKLKRFVARVSRSMGGAKTRVFKGKAYGKTIRYVYTELKAPKR